MPSACRRGPARVSDRPSWSGSCRSAPTGSHPGSAVADRVLGWPDDFGPSGDVVPLRLAGALHGLVRDETDPEIARAYPPHEVPDDALWAAVEGAFARHEARILRLARQRAPDERGPPQWRPPRRRLMDRGTLPPALRAERTGRQRRAEPRVRPLQLSTQAGPASARTKAPCGLHPTGRAHPPLRGPFAWRTAPAWT